MIVYISDAHGKEYATSVDSETIEEAVRKAVEFFPRSVLEWPEAETRHDASCLPDGRD